MMNKMKKITAHIMIVLMIVSGAGVMLYQQYSASVLAEDNVGALAGSGTEEDPYLISGMEDWDTFVDNVNAGTTYSGNTIKLAADIGIVTNGIENGKSFNGTFDGDNHLLIANLDYGTNAGGLFPSPADSITIKNLKLAGVIKGGATYRWTNRASFN